MPIYEYECVDCEKRIERFQGLSSPPPDACESCGGAMRRLVSAPAFQFKGTGWYVTDYGGRKSADAPEKSESAAAKSEKTSSDEVGGKKAVTAATSKSDSAEKTD